MKTPCVAKCKNNDGICGGCLRTMEELTTWQRLSDEEQLAIMAEIKGQPSTHSCPQCQQPAVCDISAGKSTCWCFALTTRTPTKETASACLCRACLSKQPLSK